MPRLKVQCLLSKPWEFTDADSGEVKKGIGTTFLVDLGSLGQIQKKVNTDTVFTMGEMYQADVALLQGKSGGHELHVVNPQPLQHKG